MCIRDRSTTAASADPCPRPDAAVVLEPTDLEVTLAHRGFAWYRVEYEGLAAHGSQPELGVDAIDRALDGLVALRAFSGEVVARPRHPSRRSFGELYAALRSAT